MQNIFSSFLFNFDFIYLFIGSLVRSVHNQNKTHNKQTSADLISCSQFPSSVVCACLQNLLPYICYSQLQSLTQAQRGLYTLATVEEKRRGRKKNVFCINENYWEKILSLYSQLATALCLHVNNYINSHKISNFLS